MAVQPAERINLQFLKSLLLAQLMVNKKKNAREEWLRIILRTTENTADLQKQIDENQGRREATMGPGTNW
jgi:hypothetical protein